MDAAQEISWSCNLGPTSAEAMHQAASPDTAPPDLCHSDQPQRSANHRPGMTAARFLSPRLTRAASSRAKTG